MQLLITKDIKNNDFSMKITIDSFGTNTLTWDDEVELLENFPTKISYRNLAFTRKVKVENNKVVIAEDTDEDAISVTLPALSNKELVLDKDFEALYVVNAERIAPAAINEMLTTKELVAQAYCIIFEDVICDAVADTMAIVRAKAPAYEGTDVIDV